MSKLKPTTEFLLFDDGFMCIPTGERWEDDEEGKEAREQVEYYFNRKFASRSKHLVKSGLETNTIRVHCSIKEFDEKYGNLWDIKTGEHMYSTKQYKTFIQTISSLTAEDIEEMLGL